MKTSTDLYIGYVLDTYAKSPSLKPPLSTPITSQSSSNWAVLFL